MILDWRLTTLHLKSSFHISYGSYNSRQVIIVRLRSDGYTGYGEATIIPYYNKEANKMESELKQFQAQISELTIIHPSLFWESLDVSGIDPFIQSALDIALWDLWTQMKGVRLIDTLNPINKEEKSLPVTSYTITGETPEQQVQSIKEKPWPIYKIKITGKTDYSLIETLRKVTSSPLAIDANAGLTLDQAKQWLEIFEGQNILYLEQPLDKSRIEENIVLKEISSIPIIADESFQSITQLETLAQFFDGINIKLMKLGGITNTLKIIKKARELNLKLMLGCMTETSIGISADASFLPRVEFADLDGAMLLKNDLANGVEFINGKAVFQDLPGLGIIPGLQLLDLFQH